MLAHSGHRALWLEHQIKIRVSTRLISEKGADMTACISWKLDETAGRGTRTPLAPFSVCNQIFYSGRTYEVLPRANPSDLNWWMILDKNRVQTCGWKKGDGSWLLMVRNLAGKVDFKAFIQHEWWEQEVRHCPIVMDKHNWSLLISIMMWTLQNQYGMVLFSNVLLA